jgi:DNA mismatch repair ATPase MutS
MSPGYKELKKRLDVIFTDEVQESLQQILKDISFYGEGMTVDEISGNKLVMRPNMVFECTLGEGFKLEGFKLESLTSEIKKYRSPASTISKVQTFIHSRVPDSIQIPEDTLLKDDADNLDWGIVRHVMNYCNKFMSHFQKFFDHLHFQTAFYRGAVNLADHMKRFELEYCYPKVTDKGTLRFKELKEVVMAMEQRILPVGNTCDMEDMMLLIVTGANQGGKSTFLRSVGIAQVLMQCGLMVTAKSFESGIFPSLFTHFTRREDSAMNSGRLDEELGRMNQIVEHLGERSLVLLNESFATTTEKEGSVIAYDIIKALNEAGVKVLTVTHLLSFAQKMYDEASTGQGVEFFSAQRLPDGSRTFKMIQHEPELTSFGLDLYERIVLTKQA